MNSVTFIILFLLTCTSALIPPKFHWKMLDYDWNSTESRDYALKHGDYVPENNMPSGLARWRDKLFITVPRWKCGVPSSLNYVKLDGGQQQALIPYPSWRDGFVPRAATSPPSNATVVSTFRLHVDSCDRLWAVDNGVADMSCGERLITNPAIVVFDLKCDTLKYRFELPDHVVTDSSVFTSIAVEILGKEKDCDKADTYAYITDMGSNAIVVYSVKDNKAWRVEHPYFNFDPNAGVYRVGGIDFYWNDGVSSATLTQLNKNGTRYLYLHPTSSTKQFKMSTRLLQNRNATPQDINNGVEMVGDRGPKSQATSCDFDPHTNVLFFTQLSKNGIGCWNTEKPFTEENVPVIVSDCTMLEFPSDIKVDHEGNLWILSNRQSRFLYSSMDFGQVNFRVMTSPVATVIKGTSCEKEKKCALKFMRRKSK